ncbi:MAG: peptidylprolyl isomerase, partial [Chloroflexia bacterium]|nr:peptidylprolyl isomerase [Chloroflexia bacterium]
AGSQFDAAYVAAAIALKPNEIVATPVRTDFGWHVIKLNGTTVPSVAEQIRNARSDAFETWFTALATKYPVSYATVPTATLVPAPTGVPAPLPTAPLAGYPTSTVTPVVVATPTVTATANP